MIGKLLCRWGLHSMVTVTHHTNPPERYRLCRRYWSAGRCGHQTAPEKLVWTEKRSKPSQRIGVASRRVISPGRRTGLQSWGEVNRRRALDDRRSSWQDDRRSRFARRFSDR